MTFFSHLLNMNDAKAIIDRLRIDAPDLWNRAITHSSAGPNNNERLEFLGNSVLNLCLADAMYDKPEYSEGKMSKICNYLRSDEILNEVGREIGLNKNIAVGASNKCSNITDSMVAGAFEAVNWRHILTNEDKEKGYNEAKIVVKELVLTDKRMGTAIKWHDPITDLKELVEKNKWEIMEEYYTLKTKSGNEFYYSIEIGNNNADGHGLTKKDAKLQAARKMLDSVKG